MEKVAVIADSKEWAWYMSQSLEPFFRGKITCKVYSLEDLKDVSVIQEKIVIISAYVIFKSVESKLRQDSILQIFSLSLSDDNLKKLKAIKGKRKAYLVNVDYYNCMETITQIYEAGIQNIDFIPYCANEMEQVPDVLLAVTPGEHHIPFPASVKKIIDIGSRIVDINCIIEFADKLNIQNVFSSDAAIEARRHMVFGPNGLDKILSEAESVNEKIKALIEHMDNGVVISDIAGKIYLANNKAKNIISIDAALEGFSIQDIFPSIDLRENRETILKTAGKTIIASNSILFSKGHKSGNITTIKNFEEVENRQYQVRNKLSGKSHIAHSTFEDIIGSSEIIRSTIKRARRMACSNASVLITGPSGSGKEIFAQSIHNASSRADYNFVALNCAAIPENLLESELFGYESGAFTGAKKSGKIGFFELAHKGTIFLDEIGEMSLSLQSKLLRVIEERSFSKIGSSDLIHVDVRIIAATNQNLEEQIRRKMFREDLYYRLNVLPLDIPPVKERGHDAIEILYAFRDRHHWEWKLNSQTEHLLENYTWPGNVREIRNIAEFLDNQESSVITLEELPPYIEKSFLDNTVYECESHVNDYDCMGKVSSLPVQKGESVKNFQFFSFILLEGTNLALHHAVLKILSREKTSGYHLGRLQIKTELEKSGQPYSETEIRNALKKLSDAGFIKSRRGSGGSYILETGKRLLYEIELLGMFS